MSLYVDLEHSYPDVTVTAKFELGPDVVSLFGASGSGKTTIIRIISGLLQPDKAKITFDGTVFTDTENNTQIPAYKRRIGYVFQEPRLFPHLTVQQNLTFGSWFQPTKISKHDQNHIIELLNIGSLLKRLPNKLSGGEKQRVAIGRALFSSPKLLLMDEPLASLDQRRKAELLPYLKTLRDELKLPMIYVSHSIDEIRQLTDKVLLIKDGQMTAIHSIHQFLEDNAFTAATIRDDEGVVLIGKPVAFNELLQIATIQIGNTELFIPRHNQLSQKPVKLFVAAKDVMLATIYPQNISALNIIPAIISEISPSLNGLIMVTLLIDDTTKILARITHYSFEKLQLKISQKIYAVVKSAAIETN